MKNLKVGLQLFGIREEMQKDMDSALKRVKEMGYDYVEFAGFFDKTAEKIKAILDKYELEAVSVHRALQFFLDDEEKEIEYIKKLGVKYCAIPWYSLSYNENWNETIENFTKVGTRLKVEGIKFLYHNHDFEFKKVDDEYVMDKLYKAISSDIFNPEFDTCWIHYAGLNPSEYLEKYAGRIEVVHLKDFVCEKLNAGPVYDLIGKKSSEENKMTREESGFKFRPIGEGVQDWKSILDVCTKIGAEYVIVEQDNWHEDDAMDCAEKSRKYLKNNFGI